MVDFNEIFKGMTSTEMKETLKNINLDGKSFIKEVDKVEKDAITKESKEKLEKGMTVSVKYKDEIISGEVVDIREKSFSLMTKDVPNMKGEPSRVSRNYNLIVWDTPEVSETESLEVAV